MRLAIAFALLATAADAPGLTAADYLADARAVAPMIVDAYAYPDHWPGGVLPRSAALDAERDAVHDRTTLLHYAENVVAALADHHAITGASFPDDWALVPSYADLWIEGDRITAVRAASPAANAGVVAGDRLVAVGGQPLATAVADFWARLGLTVTPERRDYAARVLAAGRRDRPRMLTIAHGGAPRTLALPSLYAARRGQVPLTVAGASIRINDSLGEQATIGAFDAAMATLPPGARVALDLRETASGGNTSVARAIMGWFVRKATPYQVHNLSAEERETGVPRRWLEEVLPRPGKFHPGPVTALVGAGRGAWAGGWRSAWRRSARAYAAARWRASRAPSMISNCRTPGWS